MIFYTLWWNKRAGVQLTLSAVFPSTATFDGKQHLLSLPVVNSVGYVLRFLKKLCRSLHCENLFSDQPITQHNGPSYQTDTMPLSGRWCTRTPVTQHV